MIDPTKNIIVSYSKLKGFGRTKAFNFFVFEDNTAILEGIRHVTLGKQSAKLTEIQIKNLLIRLNNCQFENLENKYLTQIRDLQRIMINYNSHQIMLHRRKAPASLTKLIRHLDNLIMELRWEEVKEGN